MIDLVLAPGVSPLDPATADRIRRRGAELGANLVRISPDPADPATLGCAFERRGRPFVRVRRITGYLVGGLERWNGAKRAELRDRVKHAVEVRP